ncbi:cupin domain-containing protein [Aquisalimonas asiatica]|uniref:ChrR Cupin-like domain-containing protein n=1 Tax=Aquisalimonas asiatica TaxID=406100 RepID=A0A1H8S4F1_9GAMM|nr:cupin domain-containing protein [Aquisalimonas asiatica]SEO73472.1 ChrR Cupin-like domain-containing protein [Aquisalimonas asiatica]
MSVSTQLSLPDGLQGPPADIEWTPLREGVVAAWLYRDPDGGPAAAYLRYEPGARVPAHRHPGAEHIIVLAGEQEDEYGRYPSGSVIVNPPGSCHSVLSRTGCLVLIIWAQQVEFLESD